MDAWVRRFERIFNTAESAKEWIGMIGEKLKLKIDPYPR